MDGQRGMLIGVTGDWELINKLIKVESLMCVI